MAELYFGEHVVVPYMADWASPPTLKLEHRSQLSSASSGAESRGGDWHARRRRVRYVVTAQTATEAGRIEETLRIAQEAKKAAIPYWAALRQVESASDQNLLLNAAIPAAIGRGQVLWWLQMESGDYGTVQVSLASGRGLEIQAVGEGRLDGYVRRCFSLDGIRRSLGNYTARPGASGSSHRGHRNALAASPGMSRERIERSTDQSGLWVYSVPNAAPPERWTAPSRCPGSCSEIVVSGSTTERVSSLPETVPIH
jgi:hypothetical protein